MPRLYFLDSNKTIAEITDEQLQFMVDNLEEEHSKDQDYYISRDTLEMLKEKGCDDELYSLLNGALGDGDDVDVAWE